MVAGYVVAGRKLTGNLPALMLIAGTLAVLSSLPEGG